MATFVLPQTFTMSGITFFFLSQVLKVVNRVPRVTSGAARGHSLLSSGQSKLSAKRKFMLGTHGVCLCRL